MKLGIYSSIASPPRGDNLARCVDEVVAEAQLAEDSGFDACFFGEHHQDKDGFLPSPLIVAAAVASQTRRLRVGTSVILLPLHHPVRVAEDVITLDIVSKGRVTLGVGLGYQQADFQAFGVPMEQRAGRFEEGIEIIRKCWSNEPFSFHGKYFDLDRLHVRPAPVQQPSPPLWIGAGTRPGARRAGRMADAYVTTPSTDLKSTVEIVDVYRAAAVAAGREPRVVLMRDAWVASTRAEAERVYGPEVMTAYQYYWRSGLPAFTRIESEAELTMAKVACDRLILGDPEECVKEFHRWSEATGADYFLLRLRHAHSGGPPHAEIMKAIRLFGREVIPHLG
ncbi:MAG: LLM class flavin-dependent oxidoreductase [Dehalococcoidia bacterium]|nr:LLM class flavin-dependent oxidoreductase [Dehalococcoidia bacterium]